MMRIALYLLTLCFSTTKAEPCNAIVSICMDQDPSIWTRCYEDKITTCLMPRIGPSSVIQLTANSSEKAEVKILSRHRVEVPSSALQRIGRTQSDESIRLVAAVINSSFFQQTPPPSRRRVLITQKPVDKQETVLTEQVLFLKAGSQSVSGLTEPVQLIFNHNKTENSGRCVFWKEPHAMNETGQWSAEGCDTTKSEEEFICSCNHLSFFAVLVNPDLNLKVDGSNAVRLSVITYIGSVLSALFAFISLFNYVHLHRRRPEKALGIHMQLTVALLCLHLSFLSCSFWTFLLDEKEDGLVCRGLGLFLHWSLMATFTWVALEGFHLYLLLIRVFNIYVRRYLLKLSMVGWGLPTVVAVICGILGVYGKYTLQIKDSNNQTSQICWMSDNFRQRQLVTYITLASICLVVLCNSCMLLLVVVKIRGLRSGRDYECNDLKMNKEKWPRLWKDCATVLGLSWVLALPWGLAGLTYATLLGIYLFTICNSLQGVFMFLWSVALLCKTRSENNSSVRDPSSQKMMMTSFNN
ncbi:adhesion G-protein coupled receptor G1 [Fundulus heteroclitus]|uniref:adhesion G-protein coupled receptor G1 n=1 Tax=Fundulus heteroclitus TaxID=8078 RepID=UPI00165B80DC|nr:adhesion G-protein coupled receptor G1 [Fundulus heteroclitus]